MVPYIDPRGNANLTKLIENGKLPKFNGNKHEYRNWRETIIACSHVNISPIAHKLLALRNSMDLKNENLAYLWEGLSWNKVGHTCIIESLEENFGGDLRETINQLERIKNCPNIVIHDANSIAQFTFKLNTYTKKTRQFLFDFVSYSLVHHNFKLNKGHIIRLL